MAQTKYFVLSDSRLLIRDSPSSFHNPKKRKATDAETEAGCENPFKISRLEISPENSCKTSQKETERRPRKRRVRKQQHKVLTAGDPADFVTKYDQLGPLATGGFGSVFAGVRKSDLLPVAIKYIHRADVDFVPVTIRGQQQCVPTEVVLMCQAASGPDTVGQNPSVSLLDWYSLNKEVVLVMERPTPAQDLFDYCSMNAPLPEQHAKELTLQIVDGLIDLYRKKVFHRDIKLENLLVEDTASGPRIRIIDFGYGCRVHSGGYSTFNGTEDYAPPEFVKSGRYFAGPTTVWQVGALLYEFLRSDEEEEFTTNGFMTGDLTCPRGLSKECQDFLEACLKLDPMERAGLEKLPLHCWFKC